VREKPYAAAADSATVSTVTTSATTVLLTNQVTRFPSASTEA
jgi:hypothetical protein